MSANEGVRYSHTQVGWWLMVVLGVVCLAILAIFNGVDAGRQAMPPTDLRIIEWVVLVTLVITAVLLTTLTVRVTNDTVIWRFGPGVVRFSLPLAEITKVALARTPLWAGIGIHWIFSGWVYNVSGRDAVELTKRDGSKVWLGSDQPELLAEAIESARAAVAAHRGRPPGTRAR